MMMSDENSLNFISYMKRKLVDEAGPIGGFVLKQQLKLMNETEESVSPTKYRELIEICIENCIYSPEKAKRLRKELNEKRKEFS